MRKILADQITSDDLVAAESEVISFGSYLSARHYHAALAGNISVRISEDRLLCTRHGADKGALGPDDIVLCDMDGHKLRGNGIPTSEFSMHRMAYHERGDIRAVVHAHPPSATAFAAASVPLDALMLPEMVVLLGPVALVPYATPGTEKLAEHLKLYLQSHDSFLLENHGALTIGTDLREAALRMELLEHNAQITMYVRQIGKPFVLPPGELEALMEIRTRVNQRKNIFG
ncbi:MAG: class II aldolase/adducin family protein [Acidobacteria bacterium]|nr:class II aldolase/adducin family protein [Acidobacteriota bacterium]